MTINRMLHTTVFFAVLLAGLALTNHTSAAGYNDHQAQQFNRQLEQQYAEAARNASRQRQGAVLDQLKEQAEQRSDQGAVDAIEALQFDQQMQQLDDIGALEY
ncbi:MAG: hypothetical protein I8H93_10685 [Pseudomonadales bacterium]|nr:hypothetical protein [Pseudomonadales bacterium]